jgi:hypothetical protein
MTQRRGNVRLKIKAPSAWLRFAKMINVPTDVQVAPIVPVFADVAVDVFLGYPCPSSLVSRRVRLGASSRFGIDYFPNNTSTLSASRTLEPDGNDIKRYD